MFKIGICGAAGAGKTTLSRLLEDELTARGFSPAERPLGCTLHFIVSALLGGAKYTVDRELKEAPVELLFELDESVVDRIEGAILDGSSGAISQDAAFLMALQLCRELEKLGAISIASEQDRSVICVRSTPRQLMQLIGTECGRDLFGEDFWPGLALREDGETDVALVPDVRFKNEAAQMDYLVGVVRPGYGTGTHASELDTPWLVSTADYRVPNQYSLDALEACAKVLAGVILKRLQQTQKEQ